MIDREKVIGELKEGIDFAYHRCHCGLAVTMEMALALLKAQEPRVLTLEEVLEGSGGGWAEDWLEACEEDGTPEERVLRQVAWCRGCVIDGTCSSLDADRLREFYLRKYGTRIWTGLPTDEQRMAEPWEEARPMSEAKEAGR